LGNNSLEEIEVISKELIVERFGVGVMVSVTEDVRPEQIAYRFFNCTTSMVVDKIEDVKYSWPTTWWDAFKYRFFPAWLQYHYPVNHTHRGHKVYLQYPDLAIPEMQNTVIFTKV